jgi:hypothetical protein
MAHAARNYLRSPRWVAAMLGIVCVVYGIGVVSYWFENGATLAAIGMGLLWVLFALGFGDALITAVHLEEDRLVIRTLAKSRAVQRSEILTVTWEGGVGVALKLQNGSWEKLPYLGNSQGCTNTIRAWLKRSA